MVYTAILAGGKGERMGNLDMPKQFLKLGNKEILIHTLEKFLIFNKISKILVLCPKEWINYTEDIVNKNIDLKEKIIVIEGGKSRSETILNSISFIEKEFGLNDDDVLITHDAVRPFISYKIIEENILESETSHAIDTVIPATDTIVISKDDRNLIDIPNRNKMYQGQTPQTFNIKTLKECYSNLTKEQLTNVTDAAKVVLLNNKKVTIVKGDNTNIKITTPFDLIMANAILKEK